MNDTTLATICAVVALIAVIMMLVALLLIRVMRFGVFGFATLILRMLTEPKEDADTAGAQAQAVPHIEPTDVRNLTETLDFDAAVAKYRQEQQAGEGDALIEPKPFIPDTPDLRPPLPDNSSLRGFRFRRPRG